MSNLYNNNCNKDYNEIDKKIFSLPTDNNFAGQNKKLNKNNNSQLSSGNKNNNINNNIQMRNQLLSNFGNNISKEKSKLINCKRHPQNIINYFCETDKLFLCSICISQHSEHNYITFFCSEDNFLNEINIIKKNFSEIETKYSLNKKNAEKYFLNVKNHFDEQIHKINDYFDSLISILQDKKSIFISKMLNIYENFIKELVKFKSIFDFCDKTYSNLYQKIIYIDNELYKNRDYESFYNMKDNIINDIKNFSIYNDENFYNNNRFNFTINSMPCFLYPKNKIVNINDDDILFGSFENANLYLNNDNNIIINNKLDDDDKKESSNFRYDNPNNNINNKFQIENNNLIDSIAINSTLKKEDNNNSLKRNLINLESLFEKNKNKNIISSINTNLSNINDSFIDKQLVETNSTLFLLNKNEVKNVFKQQDLDVSQNYYEINDSKTKNNNNKLSDSPKFNNNINKIKNVSCNKEKRNKQIIKKFLENENLNSNNISEICIKNINPSNHNIYFNSNNISNFENKSIINTIDEDIKINNIKNLKSSNSKRKVLDNNHNHNNNITRKRSGSMNKRNNKNIKINNSCHNLNNKKINSKNKKFNSKKKQVNNINRYFENSYGEESKQIDKNKFLNLYTGFNEKSIINQNSTNHYLLTKNNNNNIINQQNLKSMQTSNKRNIYNINSFDNKQNDILHNKTKYSNFQMRKLSSNSKNQNEINHNYYNINRSNSNRNKNNI